MKKNYNIDEFTMFENEVIHKEIDLIQSIIHRMANNSFFIKGWAVALLVGLSVFICTIKLSFVYYLALFAVQLLITLSLWYLDTFYLHTEILYRKWYDFLIVDKRYYTKQWKYVLNAKSIKQIMIDEEPIVHISNALPNFKKVFFSKTLLIFYFSLLVYGSMICICFLHH